MNLLFKSLLWVTASAFVLGGCSGETAPAKELTGASLKTQNAALAAVTPDTTEPRYITPEDAREAAPEIDIPFESFTLDNGLRVVVHEDRKTPTVAVSVWYNVGSKDEEPGKTGFAHLFEHLMFNGSENYNDEYFGPFEKAGATGMNGTTWFDRTNYFQTVPTPALDMALWMESDRMTHFEGAITEERLDEQRGVVQNEKRQGDTQPYGLAEYRVLEGLFPEGHPYRWSTIGSMADLDAASLEDVKSWFKKYYGATNTVVVLAGDIDAATAKPLMEKYFGDAPTGEPLSQLKDWVPAHTGIRKEVMYDRVPQARLDRYWAVPGRLSQDSAVLSLAAQILGSGKTSRLYKELVFERELATNISVYNEEHNLASIFTINVTLAPKSDKAARAEANAVIDEIMAEFLENGPTQAELDANKTKLNALYIRGVEEIGGFYGKAAVLAEGELYAGDPSFWKTQLGWVNAATPQLVRNSAQQWLSDGAFHLDILPFGEPESAAQGADRSALPDIGPVPQLNFPDIQTAQLSNGLKLVLAQRDAIPVINMALEFDAGYAADAGRKLGVSSFAMSMLDDGTTSLDELELSGQLDSLGATLSSSASLDSSTVQMSALKDKFDSSLTIFADIVKNPAFDADGLERLRNRWLAFIEREKAQPVQLALRLLPPALYGSGHAYGIPFTGSGTAQSTQSLTREDLLAYHQNFIRPDNATLFVVGDIDLETAIDKFENALGDWAVPETDIPVKNIAAVDLPAQNRVIIVDKPDAPQSLILGGHVVAPTGSDETLAIQTMNEALGGAFTARVNMNLREDKGWAYGAFTFTRDAKGQRPWFVYAPVQTDKTKESLQELYKEINAYLTTRPITQDELEKVVNSEVRSLPGKFETADAVLGEIVSNAKYGKPLDAATTLAQRYESLTVDSLRQTAKDTIKTGSIIWVIVGDRAQIEGPVRELGIAELEFWDTDGNQID